MTVIKGERKAFAKCKKCGYTIFTDHIPQLLSLFSDSGVFTCSECHNPLDYIQLTLCSREFSQDCDVCEHRFQCLSAKPE